LVVRRIALLGIGVGWLIWIGTASIEFAATGNGARNGREAVTGKAKSGPTAGVGGHDVDRPVTEKDEVHESSPEQEARPMIKEGRQSFRFTTYGDEAFWGDDLQLHRALPGAKQGGVGPGVSPNRALAMGLKFDVDALPADLIRQLKQKTIDLEDPAITAALLKLDAVVGVKGFWSREGKPLSIGFTCAACHSTVDDSLAPGIGHRLDGSPNLDLNLGKIISLAPNLRSIADRLGIIEDDLKQVIMNWGPGKYNTELIPMAMHFTQAGTLPPACCRSRLDSSERPQR
jgi:hypothetical protein